MGRNATDGGRVPPGGDAAPGYADQVVDATRVLQMIFGAVLGLVSVFPSSDVPLLIRLLTLVAALLVVAHGAELLPSTGSQPRQRTARQLAPAVDLLLGVAMGFVCVLSAKFATMPLRVPALFVALVLVARATSPGTWAGVRPAPVGEPDGSLDDLLAPEEQLVIGEDGSPLLPEAPAEPDPVVTGYPQTTPTMADRTRVTIPAIQVALATWLGLALLAQEHVSTLAVLSFAAMFWLFASGWRTLTAKA